VVEMEIKMMNSIGHDPSDNAVKAQVRSFLSGKPAGTLGDTYKIKTDLGDRIIMCDAVCDGPDSWRITMVGGGRG
jgi:hypothetical protein